MCLGVPGQIIEFVHETNQIAKIDINGVRRNINVGLVLPDGLKINDWVLVHAGFALSIIDEAEAQRTLQFLEELGREFEDEMDGLMGSQIE
ncbi:MAG: hydrogenase assembly protein HupF [Candidatus Entotheonella factor]|uniref:Hydrogenase assembly protein HupF n=1 Tax=Entotheonella factor TaxID=1429438 RepID=W4LHF2_ENTF1|nr:HypC/HybG/HupF family hydrogenase formation chaperone [Candidatus Entotheonella palauensis]ETW97324.1 MAG: hydrogenase assembly protein HupF [Candidatus Entotheonella factor]